MLAWSKEAISYYARAIEIEHDHFDAHFNMGIVLSRQGNIAQGAVHFNEARRIENQGR